MYIRGGRFCRKVDDFSRINKTIRNQNIPKPKTMDAICFFYFILCRYRAAYSTRGPCVRGSSRDSRIDTIAY
jgi:hypothetical protein